MRRLRVLVVALAVVIVGLMALLVILLVSRSQGTPLIAPLAPTPGLSQRTLVGLVGILSGCGCLLLLGVGAALALMWNRRAAIPSGGSDASVPPTPPHPAAPPSALVVVQGRANTAHLVLAASAVLIGRGAECTLVVDDPGVAAVHARLDPHAGGWLLTDMRSASGTYVNGRRILQHSLQPGDQIRIGQTVVEYQ
jgi:hypothetical protein